MSFYGLIVLGLVLAFVCFLGTAVYRALAVRIKLIDYPNERSSHVTPTPNSAGLIFVGLTIGCIYLVISPTNGDWSKLSLLLTFSAVALLGSMDDNFDLPVLFRMFLQALFVIGVVYSIDSISPINLLGLSLGKWTVLNLVISVLGLMWMMNLYNFMDGIDSIAASQAIFIATAGSLFLYLARDYELAFWLFILVSTLVGFLFWNLPPAKVFMGDAGSSFLGFFFGSVGLLSISRGELTVWFWLTICATFVTLSLIHI